MAVDEAGLSMAAITLPGLGPILVDQARRLGLRTNGVEYDGRADVVPLSGPLTRLAGLRTAEDILLLVGELVAQRSAYATVSGQDAKRLLETVAQAPDRVKRWLPAPSSEGHQMTTVERIPEELP